MLFSSIPFLYYFLPIVLIVYFIAPKRARNAVLLASSLLFYTWGEPKYVLLMVLSVLLGYCFGLLTERFRGRWQAKLFLILSIVSTLCFLVYFKYADFFIDNFNALFGLSVPLLRLALPIGISFYTFQILSYAVDVYRGNAKAERNIINFGAYVALFPQLIAGPIVRYVDVAAELKCRSVTIEKVWLGARRFIMGLAKKVLIANILGSLCAEFRASDEKSVLYFWLYAIAFSLHIYFDFSGYSDMAIGLGSIFGFRFPENFNYPYISKSITEFWRRWHMTLGGWFRDYVYIPLGGKRVTRARWIFNILVVWMLTGFWHGAAWNFIIWGLFFAVWLVAEKLLYGKVLQKVPVLSHIYVLFLVVISFVIFNAANMGEALSDIGGMLGLSVAPVITAQTVYSLKNYAVVLILAVIGCTPLMKTTAEKLRGGVKTGKAMSFIEPVALIALLLVSTAYLVDGSFNPFLYFRF